MHNITTYCYRQSVSTSVQSRGDGVQGTMTSLSQRYSFTVRDKILPGPPVSAQRGRRRRSSSFLEFVGKRVSPLLVVCAFLSH